MRKDAQTLPLWPATIRIRFRPALDADIATEVCVVGAGLAGISTAYRLALAGRKAVVVEARTIGAGETSRTTAHLALALDDGYATLEGIHGAARAALAARSHAAAIDEIERAVAAERIDCGFERVDGFLFPHAPDARGAVVEEFDASRRAGIEDVELLERTPLLPTGPAVRYPRQGQFHPLRYLAGLADAFERLGGRIYCGSRVVEVKGGSPARVRTEDGRVIEAGAVVIATDAPFNERFAIHTKQAAYRTYVVAASVSGSIQRGLYWDTDEPYHYARVQPDADGHDALIVGGEDHKTGPMDADPASRYDRLEAWARARFPALGPVTHRWSGQVIGTADGLAFIGRNPGDEPNVYIVTGDCGHGMTYGTIAGLMLPDLITGRAHPWEELYDPSRKRAGSLKRWEAANEPLPAAGPAPRRAKRRATVKRGRGAVRRRRFGKKTP